MGAFYIVAGVRTGWAEALTGPYWPYSRGRTWKGEEWGLQREGDERKRMREERKAGGVRQRVGQGCGWRSQRTERRASG